MPAAFLIIWFTSVNGLHADFTEYPATRVQNFCEQLARAQDDYILAFGVKVTYEGGPMTVTRVKCQPVPPKPPTYEVVEEKAH